MLRNACRVTDLAFCGSILNEVLSLNAQESANEYRTGTT